MEPIIQNVRSIEFPSESAETAVKSYLIKELEEARSSFSEMEAFWEDCAAQYYGRFVRDDAEPEDSNIDMPLTMQEANATRARLINPVFAEETVFTSTPRDQDKLRAAMVIDKVVDFMCDKANLYQFADGLVENAQVYNLAIGKVVYIRETRKIKEWQVQDVPVVDDFNQPMLIETPAGPVPMSEKRPVEVEREIVVKEGAFAENVQPEDFLYPPASYDVESAPWVAHRIYMNKGQLNKRVKNGDYKIGRDIDPRATLSDVASKRNSLLGIDVSNCKLFEVYEVYTTIGELNNAIKKSRLDEVIEGDDSEEVIVTIEKSNGVMLRAVYNWFHIAPRPFVIFCYKKRTDGMAGLSQTFILRPLHKAYSASFNQEFDAMTRANRFVGFYNEASDISNAFKNGKSLYGWWPVHGDPNSNAAVFNVSQNRTSDASMRQEIRFNADLVSSHSDYSHGFEQNDRPTASGQAAIIEEGKQPLYTLLENFRIALTDIVEIMYERYRQYYPTGLEILVKTMNQEDARIFTDIIMFPPGTMRENVIFETTVSSTKMNKNVRKQEMISLHQVMPQVYMAMFNMAGQAQQSAVALQLLQSYYNLERRFLTVMEVDRKDEILPDLTKGIQLDAFIQQLIQDNQALSRQLQATMGANGAPGGPMAQAPPQLPGGGGPPTGPPQPPGPPAQRPPL